MTGVLIACFVFLAATNVALCALLVWIHVKQMSATDSLLSAVLARNAGEFVQLRKSVAQNPQERPPATIPPSDAHIARDLADEIRAMQPTGFDGT